jgi:hypothetical protein
MVIVIVSDDDMTTGQAVNTGNRGSVDEQCSRVAGSSCATWKELPRQNSERAQIHHIV